MNHKPKGNKTYRGIAVVNAADTCEILFNFIKSERYKFCLYDNSNCVPGNAFEDALWKKFGVTDNAFIPAEFFPAEYLSVHQEKSQKPKGRSFRDYHPSPTHRLAECSEEFYAFLRMYFNVGHSTIIFFDTFVSYAEVYDLISDTGPYEYRLIDLCELYIKPYGCDCDYRNIFSKESATITKLEAKFVKENFQVSKCMTNCRSGT